MISKKVGMKTPEKSRFGKLVAYLTDTRGKNMRVGEITIANCVSAELPQALREIAATQRLNNRALSDRTYHLLISMRAGEQPDPATLKAIEGRFCAELGYAGHQRISVVHHDTDNLHIHVAINKIHPETLTIHDPKADYWIRSKLCAVLERELGLGQDRHEAKERRGPSNDLEAMSGEGSFRSWIAQYTQHFLDATSWREFHGIADACNVKLQLRGNGFVFEDKESGVAAKASDVHRRLAKQALEARLGNFIDAADKAKAKRAYEKKPISKVDTAQLWREYTVQREARSALYQARHALIRSEIAERVRAAKNDASMRRLTAKLLFKGFARKANCFAINVALGRTLRAIYRNARHQYRGLADQTRQSSWLDWLRAEAEKGRADALQALRAVRRAPATPNTLSPADHSLNASPASPGAQVTKQGTIIETVGGFPITRGEKGVYVQRTVRTTPCWRCSITASSVLETISAFGRPKNSSFASAGSRASQPSQDSQPC